MQDTLRTMIIYLNNVATDAHLKKFSTQPVEPGCTGQINSLAFCFSISELMATWRSRTSRTHCNNLLPISTGYVSFLPCPDQLDFFLLFLPFASLSLMSNHRAMFRR